MRSSLMSEGIGIGKRAASLSSLRWTPSAEMVRREKSTRAAPIRNLSGSAKQFAAAAARGMEKASEPIASSKYIRIF